MCLGAGGSLMKAVSKTESHGSNRAAPHTLQLIHPNVSQALLLKNVAVKHLSAGMPWVVLQRNAT